MAQKKKKKKLGFLEQIFAKICVLRATNLVTGGRLPPPYYKLGREKKNREGKKEIGKKKEGKKVREKGEREREEEEKRNKEKEKGNRKGRKKGR